MSFESELKAHVAAAGGVTSLIQSRFHPTRLPEGGQKPASTYQRIDTNRRNSLDGFTSGLTRIPLQLDHWGESYESARAVADAFAAALDSPASTIKFYLLSDREDYEPETKLFRVMQEYSCWHSQ